MRRLTTVLSVLVLLSAFGIGRVAYATFSAVTSNPGSALTAAASFAPCTAYTPVWMDGMEYGALNNTASGFFDQSSAGATIDATVAHGGTYSLKITDNANNSAQYASIFPTGSPATAVLRFAIRFPSLPAANVLDLVAVMPGGSGKVASVGYDASTHKLTIGNNNAATNIIAESANAISANTWYVVDYRANHSANPTTYDWAVDGVAQTGGTYAQSAQSLSQINWGGIATAGVFTAYFDDMIYSTNAADFPMGVGTVRAVVPNGVGTITNPGNVLQDDNGTAVSSSSWSKLSDLPMTTTTTYVKQTAVDTGASLELTLGDTALSCVEAVSAAAFYSASATQSDSAKTALYDSGTERVVYSGDMSTTTLDQHQAVITPASGNWTPAKLNALTAKIGFASSMGGQPYWQGLVVQYATNS